MSERRGVKGLELWCKKVTSEYPGVKVENMTTSWRNGLAFCAIIHRFRPDLIDFFKLNKDNIYENNELAFRIAEHHLGIPALLEPIDMVQYEVPDRLSILTYLSQFYQAFAVREGSNSITGKRLQPPPDHELGSPTSSSPPSKVASVGIGRARRQPCAKCNQHVYIAERLNVGKSLFHRPCFRCARCGAQLAPASYYETENGEFCCEVCPDEEKGRPGGTQLPSASQEEKGQPSALSIVNIGQPDDYSAVFEAALESVSPAHVAKRADLEKFLGYQSDFPTDPRSSDSKVSLSFNYNLGSIDNVTKDEKQLSVRARMRLFEDSSSDSNNFTDSSRPFSYIKGSKGISNGDRINDPGSSNEPSKDIPITTAITGVKGSDTLEDTTEEISTCTNDNVDVIVIDSSPEEKNEAVSETLECTDHSLNTNNYADIIVIESTPEDNYAGKDISEESITVHLKEEDSKANTDEDVLESTVSSTDIILSSPDEKFVNQSEVKNEAAIKILECTTGNSINSNSCGDIIVIESTPEGNDAGSNISQESVSVHPKEEDSKDNIDEDVLKSTAGSTEIIVRSPEEELSQIVVEESSQESVSDRNEEICTSNVKQEETSISLYSPIIYPVDLNPFGDEEETEFKPKPPTRKKQSITPVPAERRKETLSPRRKSSLQTQYHTAVYDDDLNPFGEGEDEDEEESSSQSLYVSATNIPTPQPRRRKISLPLESKKQVVSLPVYRISVNPYDGTEVVIKKNLGIYNEDLNPFSDSKEDGESDLSASALTQDSIYPTSSLSIDSRLMYGSTSSISSGSIHGSARKKKPAPRPPIFNATFNGDSVVGSPSPSNVSSPSAARKHRKGKKAPPPPMMTSTPAIKSVREVKVETDFTGNDQQEPIHRNLQGGLSRFSHLNKSTHGRWKQKKNPAPALPIPQKRTIKSLPMSDIRRELDLIEIQQQGLEKQSVKIEQMIREKEEDESEIGEDLPIEVEDLLLQLFEIVNEKNELLRKQTELMYLKKEQRLEEEHAEIEYQIRCLMAIPEDKKTASDKEKEDELIKLLVDVVERRNEIIKCLDMDRVKEADEDSYISTYVDLYASKRDQESLPQEEKKQDQKESKDTLRKKIKRKFKHKKKSKTEPEKDKTTKN